MPMTTTALASINMLASTVVSCVLGLLLLASQHDGFQSETSSPPSITPTTILGSVETVQLPPITFPLEARIDTGADLSSLDARNIREFGEKEQWVSFEVEDRHSGERLPMTLPIVRHMEIKRHNRTNNQCRPVVRLPVALGEITFTTEFTLIDRSNLHYPVLIGRQDLQNRALVDVSLNHTQPLP